MEQITYLEQFKQEIQKLIFENIDELSKVVKLNTPTYQGIIRYILGEVIKEAELNKQEAQYLVEIRKQWQLHLFFLKTVRITYELLKFKKIPRPKEFDDKSLPAYIELIGSVVPTDNQLIVFTEQQHIYYQYLQFAKILEGAMIAIEICLSDRLGVRTNFEKVKDADSGDYETTCKIGDEFMVELIYKEDPIRINEIKEAEAFVRQKLDLVYANAKPEYYTWLVKSILKFPFPEVEIPKVGQEKNSFIIPYESTKIDLYNKIRIIKRKIYPDKKGSAELAQVFYDSTKNFNDNRKLKISLLKSKM